MNPSNQTTLLHHIAAKSGSPPGYLLDRTLKSLVTTHKTPQRPTSRHGTGAWDQTPLPGHITYRLTPAGRDLYIKLRTTWFERQQEDQNEFDSNINSTNLLTPLWDSNPLFTQTNSRPNTIPKNRSTTSFTTRPPSLRASRPKPQHPLPTPTGTSDAGSKGRFPKTMPFSMQVGYADLHPDPGPGGLIARF